MRAGFLAGGFRTSRGVTGGRSSITVALVGRLQMRPATLVQLGCICLHPTPNATGVHLDATFGDQFADVLVRERIAQIPAHAQNHAVASLVGHPRATTGSTSASSAGRSSPGTKVFWRRKTRRCRRIT